MNDVPDRVRRLVQQYLGCFPNTRLALSDPETHRANYLHMRDTVARWYLSEHKPSMMEWQFGLNREVIRETEKLVTEIVNGREVSDAHDAADG